MLSYYWLIIVVCIVECNGQTSQVINVVVALPSKPHPVFINAFQFTYSDVQPILYVAGEKVRKEHYLSDQYKLKYIHVDSNCSDVEGPQRVVDQYCIKEVDLILGFACVYALAPVARMSSLWNEHGIPTLTTIGFVDTLDDKTSYRLLTRMNGSYRLLAQAIFQLAIKFSLSHYSYLWHSFVKDSAQGKSECHFQMNAFNNYQYKRTGRTHPYISFDETSPEDYEQLLKKASMGANNEELQNEW